MTENVHPTVPLTDPLPYDALLLCSFGGPNGPEDVIPFLRNVTRGKGIPEERLAEVGEHYHHCATPPPSGLAASSPSSPAPTRRTRAAASTASTWRRPSPS
jgi:hypothetical protein